MIGDNVNIANRLAHLAKHDCILLSHATYKMIQDRITVIPVPSLKLKGIKEPVQAYLVKSIKSYHLYFQAMGYKLTPTKQRKGSIERLFGADYK